MPHLAGCIFLLAAISGTLIASDIRPAALVGADAGLVIEFQEPVRTWEEIQRGDIYRRWRKTSFAQDVMSSEPMKRWNEIDSHVLKVTGVSLTEQLNDLCAQELVLALFLPATEEPQGVLIARAESADAVERFLATWAQLDPKGQTQTHEHRGEKYFSRPNSGQKQARLYFATFGDLFAVSDRETRIQQIIDLRKSPANVPKASSRITDSEAYRIAVATAGESTVAMRAVLVAAPWQRVWQESAGKDAFAGWLAEIWPAIDSIGLHVRTDDGMHIDFHVHVDPSKAGERWQAFTASTFNPQEFLTGVPPQAVLAAAGGVHFQPLWETFSEIATQTDRDGFKRGRRLLRGFLGGKDLFTDILPALTNDVGAYLVPTAEVGSQVLLDGVVQFRFPPQPESKEMFLALDQALSSGLTLISAQANEAHEEAEPTTVHSEVGENMIYRWLESPLPIRVAYRLTPAGLTISRTPEMLRSLPPFPPEKSAPPAPSFFLAARDKWCPNAGQVLIVDVARLQKLYEFTFDETPAAGERVQHSELLSLCDVAYVAIEMEVERLTIRLGVAAE